MPLTIKKVHGIHLCGKAGRHAARRTVRTHGSGRKKAPAFPAGNILEKSLYLLLGLIYFVKVK